MLHHCSRSLSEFRPGNRIIPLCDHLRAGFKHSLPGFAILISDPPRSPAGARSGVGWQPLRGDVGPSGGRPVCQLCPNGPQLRGQAHEHGHEPRHCRARGLPALPRHPHHANQCRVSPHDRACQALDPKNPFSQLILAGGGVFLLTSLDGKSAVEFWARFGTPIQAVAMRLGVVQASAEVSGGDTKQGFEIRSCRLPPSLASGGESPRLLCVWAVLFGGSGLYSFLHSRKVPRKVQSLAFGAPAQKGD
jgi:hypothetical protein